MTESSDKNESAALGIDDETPELYALVDMTTVDGITILKRAPLDRLVLWGVIFGMEGRQTKRLDLITSLEHLQYLYWNTTQIAPSEDLQTLKTQCAQLANNMPEDTTSEVDLRSRIPVELLQSLGNQKGDLKMGQGASTEGALEKGKKSSKKAAKNAAPAEGATDGAASAETKAPKKEKDPTGRPGEGTSTRKVWDIADQLAASNNNVTPTRAAVIEAAVKAGVNKATAGVQYGAWFKGMNRTPAPVPVKEEKKTEAPAAGGAATA